MIDALGRFLGYCAGQQDFECEVYPHDNMKAHPFKRRILYGSKRSVKFESVAREAAAACWMSKKHGEFEWCHVVVRRADGVEQTVRVTTHLAFSTKGDSVKYALI